jgi:hypothetical protein
MYICMDGGRDRLRNELGVRLPFHKRLDKDGLA